MTPLHPGQRRAGLLDCHAFRTTHRPACDAMRSRRAAARGRRARQSAVRRVSPPTPRAVVAAATCTTATPAKPHDARDAWLPRLSRRARSSARRHADCDSCHASLTGRVTSTTARSRPVTRGARSATRRTLGKTEVEPCATCHADQPVLAPDKHTCPTCHSPQTTLPGPAPVVTRSVKHAIATASAAIHRTPTGCRRRERGRVRVLPCQRASWRVRPCTAAIGLTPASPTGASDCAPCHADRAHTTRRPDTPTGLPTAHRPAPHAATATCARCHADKAETTNDTGDATARDASGRGNHNPKAPPPPSSTAIRARPAVGSRVMPPVRSAIPCTPPRMPASPPARSCHVKTELPGLHAVGAARRLRELPSPP